MRCIIGQQWYPTIDGSSVTTTRSASDPVPTCTVNIVDNASTLTPQELQEILILDDQIIPNPTINMLLNPSMNPYNSHWGNTSVSGLTFSQNPGGGTQCAVLNAAVRTYSMASQTLSTTVAAGQTYCFSAYIQGSSSPTNISTNLKIFWLDGSGNNFIGSPSLFTGPVPTGTGLVRYSLTATAPAGAVYAEPLVELNVTNATNSGTITITQPQFEPVWFPTLSYPTPWCAGGQTNCQQLPNSLYIRQYRKFAGFVTLITAQDYHGNVRTLVVNAVGYAWLMSTIFANDTFSNQADSAIISALLNKYVLNNGAAMCTTTNVVTGQTFTSLQIPWDDLRTTFDNLAAQATYYWTIDYYWNFIFAPPGYFSMQIGLICDDSSQPDMVTTFPAYNFSHDGDSTQPGSNILVIGNGSNVAQVIDPSVSAQIGIISGYTLPMASSWMRKVNESSLASNTDCENRGMAELIQYDKPRNLYHLTTNVEMTPGNGVQVTSNTDGLNQTTLLIQQTQATWIGTNEKLTDQWEYVSDLGATNKAATHILSRLFRLATANTSAPAVAVSVLATLEPFGIVDTVATTSPGTGYQATILADTPIAYYRLDELQGTIADDSSGNAYQGSINGGVTLGAASLLTDPADTGDTAMTFNGASGFIGSLSTSMIPTGAHAWSLECWCRVSSLPTNQWNAMVGWGNRAALQMAVLYMNNTSSVYTFQIGFFGSMLVGSTFTTNTTYHVVGTYDGTNVRLYVNGALVAGPTAFALNLVANFVAIGADGASVVEFYPGTLDECAFYNYALSAVQVSAHYTAGT